MTRSKGEVGVQEKQWATWPNGHKHRWGLTLHSNHPPPAIPRLGNRSTGAAVRLRLAEPRSLPISPSGTWSSSPSPEQGHHQQVGTPSSAPSHRDVAFRLCSTKPYQGPKGGEGEPHAISNSTCSLPIGPVVVLFLGCSVESPNKFFFFNVDALVPSQSNWIQFSASSAWA